MTFGIQMYDNKFCPHVRRNLQHKSDLETCLSWPVIESFPCQHWVSLADQSTDTVSFCHSLCFDQSCFLGSRFWNTRNFLLTKTMEDIWSKLSKSWFDQALASLRSVSKWPMCVKGVSRHILVVSNIGSVLVVWRGEPDHKLMGGSGELRGVGAITGGLRGSRPGPLAQPANKQYAVRVKG